MGLSKSIHGNLGDVSSEETYDDPGEYAIVNADNASQVGRVQCIIQSSTLCDCANTGKRMENQRGWELEKA